MNQALQELQTRGFVSQCTNLEELSALMDREKVTFYVGCDPTGPSLHVGHMVPFFAFQHMRAHGHRGIALLGGGTARIGDPSGKTSMRKMLSYEQLDENALSIKRQLDRFLRSGPGGGRGFDDPSDPKATAICANNKDWLADLNYIDFLREIGVHFSVNRMLSFEAYKQRMETGLSFIEFNYQLLQSYDFLQLHQRYGCSLQIGGDDQWGNITAGADLIRRIRGNSLPAFGLTFPLVTTSDGKKMGKTEKGALFLDPNLTSPYDFFQYWRNVQDADALKFLLLFTFLPADECKMLCGAGKNPNLAKERLAYEVTALIHGKDEAEKALSAAKAAFGGSGASESLPCTQISGWQGGSFTDLFCAAGLCPTKSEARRLIQQGGAFYGNDAASLIAIKDVNESVDAASLDAMKEGRLILRAGKKRFCRLSV